MADRTGSGISITPRFENNKNSRVINVRRYIGNIRTTSQHGDNCELLLSK